MSEAQSPLEQPYGHIVWERWLREGIQKLDQAKLLRSLRPIEAIASNDSSPGTFLNELRESRQINVQTTRDDTQDGGDVEGLESNVELERNRIARGTAKCYDGRGEWDSIGTTATVSAATLSSWIQERTSAGNDLPTADSPSSHLKLFSGNDYLGLALHPAVRAAAASAALLYGMGPRASALVSGYTTHHRQLETALAALCHTEECLLCPTGFSANMAAITALASAHPPQPQHHQDPPPSASTTSHLRLDSKVGSAPEVAVFSDALNHASIIDGVRLAQRQLHVTLHVYRHSDMEHLDSLLSRSEAPRKLVVTDSLFSMDGDFAPLQSLAALRAKHGFLLLVDEAHATLVCGSKGGGAAEACGVNGSVDIHVGTLSKAVGCQGGFIACSREWKQWILSKGRAYIYSTAIPIPVVAAALAALQVARKERWRQEALWQNVCQLSQELGIEFRSPICPIVIGGAKEALAASRSLLLAGFHVPAIRPPTVADGSSRLRVALSASHTPADIAALVAALPLSVKAKALQHAPHRSLSHPSLERSTPRHTHTQQCQTDEKPSEVEDGEAFHTFVFNHGGAIHISRL